MFVMVVTPVVRVVILEVTSFVIVVVDGGSTPVELVPDLPPVPVPVRPVPAVGFGRKIPLLIPTLVWRGGDVRPVLI